MVYGGEQGTGMPDDAGASDSNKGGRSAPSFDSGGLTGTKEVLIHCSEVDLKSTDHGEPVEVRHPENATGVCGFFWVCAER